MPTTAPTIDVSTLNKISKLHPKLREEALKIFEECNKALSGRAKMRITSTLRTFEEQQALYDQGRKNKLPKVTNAKPGTSFHNYGMAIDFCLIVDNKTVSWDTLKDFDGDKKADWMEVVAIFKKHGWTWGGDFKTFKDYPHFEKSFGKKWPELYELYMKGKFIKEKYVSI